MGCWGYGPFDCDSAADMVAKLTKPIVLAATRKRCASYHYGEARAAIQMILLAHGTDILGGPPLAMCLDALTRIVGDEQYVNDFKEPLKAATQLRKELRQVKRAMAKCEGCSPRAFRKKKAAR